MAILSCHVSIKLPGKISDDQGNSYPRQATATSNWLSCQGWQVHGMDLGPWNASRMDHFKISGRVPHERRYLHTLRPYILTLVIEIVMIHVRIFIFLLHSHSRSLQ